MSPADRLPDPLDDAELDADPAPLLRHPIGRRLERLDVALFERVAAARPGLLDRPLVAMSTLADGGLLWYAVAGLAWWKGGRRGRRAAVQGLASLGVAAALVNGPAKLTVRRPRPPIEDVPAHRRPRRPPRTTSFPSGHAGTSSAFAVGFAAAWPLAGVPVGALAASVGYSRVHRGVHYPSDVAVGAAAGAALAGGVVAVDPAALPVLRRLAGTRQKRSIDRLRRPRGRTRRGRKPRRAAARRR